MTVAQRDQTVVETEHARLIAYGRFAEQVGLLAALAPVPVAMKTVEHSPGEQTAESLAPVLAGGMHVDELATSPHPLVVDQPVAEAWGQTAFASASGVNGLLRSVAPATVEALQATLRRVLAPHRHRILREVSAGFLVVDLDLTGLVVGDQAATYEGAAFGDMGELDGVGRGDQFARAQLVGRTDTLVLGGVLHPGATVEAHCLGESVAPVEAELGRPRRRVELLEGRLGAIDRGRADREAEMARRAAGGAFLRRRQRHLETARAQLHAQRDEVRARRDALAADNAANPNPRRIILRLDGGFGDAARLAWLYEQGDDCVARARSHRVADRLRRDEGLCFHKVSKNGFSAESRRTDPGACPYPLRLFARTQWWGEERPARWSALVVPPSRAAEAWPTRRVGVFDNGRQAIEAGTKEGKGLFASRHLPTRHQAGIAFYQESVLLARNPVRWFRRQFLGRTVLAAAGVQELVRIGANSRAQVLRRGRDIVLAFAHDSPWRGIVLPLTAPFAYQLSLPLLDDWAAVRT